MIIVKWLEGDSQGYNDHLPDNCMRVTSALVEHAVVGPKGWIRIGRCSVTVDRKLVTFDYSGEHKAWNTAQDFYIGQMRFEFANARRTGVPLVLWKDDGEHEDFQPGFAVAELCEDPVDELKSAPEGDAQFKAHVQRERSAALREEKLLNELATKGAVRCEACSADLVAQYGKHGLAGYEVHHRKPIADGSRETYLKDLAVLCANCHRVLHRTKPIQGVHNFAKLIRRHQGSVRGLAKSGLVRVKRC
ncbi:HNH endonuclease [Bradyrhizobium guangxiense]|uniref:HNH endonuclease n=1 Tax=Bradyrhizobium guangxiense TaxID=1325115 RepID=UPI0010089587|nr:HNH endonuclease [Bradyrhizobium guangxiense]